MSNSITFDKAYSEIYPIMLTCAINLLTIGRDDEGLSKLNKKEINQILNDNKENIDKAILSMYNDYINYDPTLLINPEPSDVNGFLIEYFNI